MGDLSEHFNRFEFGCHCGCSFGLLPGQVAVRLVALLERLREHFDAPVSVVSGCRCRTHNRAVGGAPSSRHLIGEAADIKVHGVPPKAVADWLSAQYPHSCGIGRYRTWTHIDVRDQPARWGAN